MFSSAESSLTTDFSIIVPSSPAIAKSSTEEAVAATIIDHHKDKKNITPKAAEAAAAIEALAEKIAKLAENLPTLVTAPATANKKIEIILNKEKLAKVNEIKKRNKKRLTSQNEAMGDISAEELMQALGLAEYGNRGWEWLHLIAYCLLGEEAQISDNMAAGTHEANTGMILPEHAI